MQEAIKLATHRLDHSRRAMSGVKAANAPGKINQPVTVNIFDHGSFSPGNEDRRGVISRLHNSSITPLHKRLRPRSGNGCAQLNGGHKSVLSSNSSVLSEAGSAKVGFTGNWQLTTGHC